MFFFHLCVVNYLVAFKCILINAYFLRLVTFFNIQHYFAPSGLKFNSKVEVTRYLKTIQYNPPELKQEKDAIFLKSAEDASADAVEKECPNSEEKGKLGLELSSLNVSCRIHCLLSLCF